jgi:hypothetical protein
MKQIASLVCIVAALAGCAPMMQAAQRQKQIEAQQAQQQRNNDRMQQAVIEIQACGQKRKDGIYKNHTESNACVNDATERAFGDINYPWMDLIYSLDATRAQLAAQVDEKNITEADAKAKLAEKASEIASEDLTRNTQLASTAAAQQQANAAQQATQSQAATAFLRAFAQPSPMPGGTAGARLQYMQQQPALNMHSTQCTTNAIGNTLQTNCNQNY